MASVARATAEDCHELADIQFDAFSPSVIHQTVFANVTKENSTKKLGASFAKCVEGDSNEVFKAFVRDAETGRDKLVGLAIWDLPKAKDKKRQEADEKKKKEEGMSDEEKRAEREKHFPDGANYDLAASFFGRLDPQVDEPFYRLSILAIDPATQRTGAGAKLLKWGCHEADKAGVATFLEATDVGVGLYRKWGFEMWGEPITGGDNNEMILWPMRRPPLEIRPFRRSDFPSLCEIYYEAFEPTTIWQYNFKHVTRQASDRSFKRRLEDIFDEIDNDGNTCTSKRELVVAVRGDKVLGFAAWEKVPDKSGRPEKKGGSVWAMPEGADEEQAKELLSAIRAAVGAYEKKHWYLGLLAINPKTQKGGIGRVLTEWGIERAKKDGADVVLGSTEFGKKLYESLGFKDFGDPVVASKDPNVINWPMLLRTSAE